MSIWEKMGLKSDISHKEKIVLLLSLPLVLVGIVPHLETEKQKSNFMSAIIGLYIIIFVIFVLLRIGCDVAMASAYDQQSPLPHFWHVVDKITGPPFRILGTGFIGYLLLFAVFLVGGAVLIKLEKRVMAKNRNEDEMDLL